MEPSSSLFPSKPSIHDFELSSTEVGTGNYSTVFKALHRPSGRHFALKRIDKGIVKRMSTRNPNIQNEILQEKHIGARIGDAWTCGLHCTWSDSDALYFVYELAEGGDLWTARLTAALALGDAPRVPCPLDEAASAALVRVLTRCLSHFHSLGVAHRDIKPENIVLSLPSSASPAHPFPGPEPVQVKVVDLGSCKDLVCPLYNHPRSDSAGTPEYMAPECISPRPGSPVDSTCDLWSLGCVAYRLLAGCVPFAAPSPYLSMHRTLAYGSSSSGDGGDDGGGPMGGLLFPPGTSRLAQAFVRALLQGEPEQRLGVTGRVGGAGEGGSGLPPGWALTPSTRAVLDALSQGTRTATTTTAAAAKEGGRGQRHAGGGAAGSHLGLPPHPCCIEHGAILAHPWLALGEGEGGAQGGGAWVHPLPQVEGHARVLALAHRAAHAPVLSPAQLYTAMTEGGEAEEGEGRAWRELWACVQALAQGERQRLAHVLALWRRLPLPHVWCLLWQDWCTARTQRLVVREGGGEGGDSAHYCTVGPHGPRVGQAWGTGPQLYCRRAEVDVHTGLGAVYSLPPHAQAEAWLHGESSSWPEGGTQAGAGVGVGVYFALLPLGQGSDMEAVQAYMSAVLALSPPPLALILLLGPHALPLPAVRAAVSHALGVARSGMPALWAGAGDGEDGREEEGTWSTSCGGTRLLFTAPSPSPSALSWLAGDLAYACSTHQHTLLFLPSTTQGPVLSLAAGEGVEGGCANVRYVSCVSPDPSLPPAAVPPTLCQMEQGEGEGWRALRVKEVHKRGGGKVKGIVWPQVQCLLSPATEGQARHAHVALLKVGRGKVQPGYATVHVTQQQEEGEGRGTGAQAHAWEAQGPVAVTMTGVL